MMDDDATTPMTEMTQMTDNDADKDTATQTKGNDTDYDDAAADVNAAMQTMR